MLLSDKEEKMSDSYYNDNYGMGVDSDGNSFYYNSDTGMTYYSGGDSSYYNSSTDMTYYSSGDSSYYNSTYGMRYGGPSSSSSSGSSSNSYYSSDYSYSSEHSGYSYSGSGSSSNRSSYRSSYTPRLSAHDKELGKATAKSLMWVGIGFAIFCVIVVIAAVIASTGVFEFLRGPIELEVSGINCTVTNETSFSRTEKTNFGVVPDEGYEFAYFINGREYTCEAEIKPDKKAERILAVCLPIGGGKTVTENSITIPISPDKEALGSEYFYSGDDAATYEVNSFYLRSMSDELNKMAERYSYVSITFTMDIREEAKVLAPECSFYGHDLTNSRQEVGISFGGDVGYVTFDHGGDEINTEYETHSKTTEPISTSYLDSVMHVFFRIDSNFVNGTEGCPAWYMKNAYLTFTFSN